MPSDGPIPRAVVHTDGTLKLYHLLPVLDEIYRVPVLLVMPILGRISALDLLKNQSLAEHLVRNGFDVYVINWGIPRDEDHDLGLEDYVLKKIPDCVAQVAEHSEIAEVSIMAYCLGGTFACMYAALHPKGPLRNLVCFTTPVDSEGLTLFRDWKDGSLDIDEIVGESANIPPELIASSLREMKFDRPDGGDRWDEDEFLRLCARFERWSLDQIPVAGRVARQLTQEFLRGNKLAKGTLRIAGRRVELEKIRIPLLHISAEYDRIVPSAASRELVLRAASRDKTELVIKSGHVDLFAGGNAVYRLWPKVEAWLASRSV